MNMTTVAKERLLRSAVVWVVIIAAAGVAGAAGYTFARADAPQPPPLSVQSSQRQPGFAALAATVRPAVVNISTEHAQSTQQMPFTEGREFNDMLRRFFGQNGAQMFQRSQRPTHALGSGFVIDPAGYIVTNNHVIDGASDIEVTLSDETVHRAQIIGRDPKTDLALLKIDPGRTLPYVKFGDSDKVSIGDWVLAAGNPYGLEGSVSAGIVSAKKRNINEGPYDDFLQIDAPINPGNSGGPLFDESGNVIGIDTAIYTPSGGSVGIGFAIPSNVAESVVAQLRAHGKVSRGWLGVQMQQITPALASAIGLPKAEGVLVDQVLPDSPAAHGGVAQGDVIVSMDGKTVDTTRDLAVAVAAAHAQQLVRLSIWRNGHKQDIEVTIATEKNEGTASLSDSSGDGGVGLALAPLTDTERTQLNVTGGAMVSSVTPDSPADLSGVEPGDVILRVGGTMVNSPTQAQSAIRIAESDHKPAVPLLVERNGVQQYLPLTFSHGSG